MKLSAAFAMGLSPLLHAGSLGAASAKCLKASMGPSNSKRYPNANGSVEVCFDGSLKSDTGGTMRMNVAGLKVKTIGGVHIHSGTSCATTSQGGHYYDPANGDPWFNAENSTIAPFGTGYASDAMGTGRADFTFDDGYGYDDTVGKVVVVHDTIKPAGGDYERIACGVLTPAGGGVSKEEWYADSTNKKCVMSCDTGTAGHCGGIRASNVAVYDTAESCCGSQLSWIDSNLCKAMSTMTHTNKYYADIANNKCSKDCKEGTGTSCQGYPDNLSSMLFDTASACCSTKLGWLDNTECVANSKDISLGGCLQAAMSSSNDNRYPKAVGYVTVCFGGELSATSGTMSMFVKNLNTSSTTVGGVHIHSGTSCITSSQMGHYYDPNHGDPWVNTPNSTIAPTGTSYSTDKYGTGKTEFQFDQGYGYEDSVGKVVVIHDAKDGDYTKVSCGVLVATSEKMGSKKWYAHSDSLKCVQDCKTGFDEHCGGLRADNYVSVYNSADTCCANKLYWINPDICKAASMEAHTNKWYVDYKDWKCIKDCEKGTGACGGSPMDLSSTLFDSAETCCANKLGWLNGETCYADSMNGGCLRAQMGPSNELRYPSANGYVTVCFDGKLSDTSGTLSMFVKDLNTSSTTVGGVHVHNGTSCINKGSQKGHYYDPNHGDPWFNTVNSTIAPTGTSYKTDSVGTGRANFQFDDGYGYAATVGKVIVIHDAKDGDYTRVSCGVLSPVEHIGSKKWYADAYGDIKRCRRDCEVGTDEYCGGIKETYSVAFFDSYADCCGSQFNYMDAGICAALATSTYTNKFYVDYATFKCSKDCKEGSGSSCGGHPDDLSVTLYDTAADCCSNKLGWFDRATCVAATNDVSVGGCLQAAMSSSNVNRYPNAVGYVTVCFDGKLSATSGTMSMYTKNLNTSSTTVGGVHVHNGTSCINKDSQKGHYYDPNHGDPWFNTVNSTIAPTGASYSTNAVGTGRADFQFDDGYGYDKTVGKVIVIHDAKDGDYVRVACGVLGKVTETIGSKKWYADIDDKKCVQDCKVGLEDHCGGVRKNTYAPTFDSVETCCAGGQFNHINPELCAARSTSSYTNKYYVDYSNTKCSKHSEGEDGPVNLSVELFGTAELCCSAKLSWSKTCAAESSNTLCLEAQMGPSDDNRYPNAKGIVSVCFDGALSDTSGALQMRVENLNTSSTTVGGVHIHSGTSCALQGKHYFDETNGDPWFNTANSTIAPTGTSYSTDSAGFGTANFKFDDGYGYVNTVGKVIVIHDAKDGDYVRVSCGVLAAVDKLTLIGTDEYYVDWKLYKCVKNCVGPKPCGGIADEYSKQNLSPSRALCCSTSLPWLDPSECFLE